MAAEAAATLQRHARCHLRASQVAQVNFLRFLSDQNTQQRKKVTACASARN